MTLNGRPLRTAENQRTSKPANFKSHTTVKIPPEKKFEINASLKYQSFQNFKPIQAESISRTYYTIYGCY